MWQRVVGEESGSPRTEASAPSQAEQGGRWVAQSALLGLLPVGGPWRGRRGSLGMCVAEARSARPGCWGCELSSPKRRWRRRRRRRGSVSGPFTPRLLQPPLQPRGGGSLPAASRWPQPGALGKEKGARTRVPGGAGEDLLRAARLPAGSPARPRWPPRPLARASSSPAPGSSLGWRGLRPPPGWWERCARERKCGGPGPSPPSADECPGAQGAEAGAAAVSPQPDLCLPQRQRRRQRERPWPGCRRQRRRHLHHAGGTAALPVLLVHAGADCPGHPHLLPHRAVPLHLPHPQAEDEEAEDAEGSGGVRAGSLQQQPRRPGAAPSGERPGPSPCQRNPAGEAAPGLRLLRPLRRLLFVFGPRPPVPGSPRSSSSTTGPQSARSTRGLLLFGHSWRGPFANGGTVLIVEPLSPLLSLMSSILAFLAFIPLRPSPPTFLWLLFPLPSFRLCPPLTLFLLRRGTVRYL